MKHRTKIRGVILVVLATAVTASWPANAETIFLQCTYNNGGAPVTFTVDLTSNTINNLPATINATSIDWQRTYTPSGATDSTTDSEANHIGRSTGIYTRNDTIHWSNGNVSQMDPTVASCVKGSPPPTKF